MHLDYFFQKMKSYFSGTDVAVFAIVFLYLSIGIARVAFGVVPIYLLVALVPMFFIALLRPTAGVYAAIFLTVIFERFFALEALQFGRDAVKLYPLDVVLLGVYGGALAKLWFGKARFVWKAADVWLAIFFALVSVYFIASFAGFGSSEAAVAFSTWKNYVFYGALVFALPLMLTDESDVRRLVGYFLTAATLALFFLMIGVIRGEGLWTEFTPLSTAGVRLLAFPHAFYFSLAFLGLFATAAYWLRSRYRALMWIAMALWMFGIFGSLMRHLWVGIAFAALGIFLLLLDQPARQAVRRMAVIALASGTAFLALWLFVAFLFPMSGASRAFQSSAQTVAVRILSIGSGADESISWRGSVWQSAFAKLAENPLFGTGLGLRIPVESGEYHDFVEIRNIHNSWLALLVQMGIIGYFVFAAALIVRVWNMYRLRTEAVWLAALRNATLALFAYQAIVLLAQPYLETNLLGIFFWVTLGLMSTASWLESAPDGKHAL
ncbi:MAG: hypothetical protein A3E38_00995 [Candidatus Moranbacteria bacterium RIFCSPHIGHO2_12_FULL_54_9]|nr:MAG: hypothetical protein A2878_00160 [Candidatus Moranbacteria bacterium RIFCSPHIGHO2_01_FULL_54_31]OGI25490.1 MAG: hypothetical protein A3E38_00995 [Candidatus Moranbacteria bacterium RIFCSPHIGHO2_12_FULL_54_9]